VEWMSGVWSGARVECGVWRPGRSSGDSDSAGLEAAGGTRARAQRPSVL